MTQHRACAAPFCTRSVQDPLNRGVTVGALADQGVPIPAARPLPSQATTMRITR